MLGRLLAEAKQLPSLQWAVGVAVKEEVEKQVLALIGPKDERDVVVKKKVSEYQCCIIIQSLFKQSHNQTS